MLKRLKAQVSQVANELPGVLSPNSMVHDSRDDSFLNSSDAIAQNEEIEGFLCPMCMTTFTSPELLSGHFEKNHNETSTGVLNPNFTSSDVTDANVPLLTPIFSSKDKEIEELRLQIREEKSFAEKLKDELDRIHLVVAQATDTPEGEVPYLLQQIQVLEAGKSMVTQRMLEFEKENTQLRRSLESGQQERAEIMSKLKQLSGQIRNLTDDCEGNKVEKELISKELTKYKLSNENLERKICDLNKTLDQRPSEDDVAVLRTELVHAQKLMDEISQQKDVEIQEHLNSIRQLNMEREKQHCVLENLQKQVNDKNVQLKESQEWVESISVELTNTCQLLDNSKENLNTAVEEVIKKEKRIEELQMRVDTNVSELTACREKISQLEETVRMSGREIDDSHFFNEKNQEKLLQLSEKLEQMIEDKKRYESDLCGFEEKQEAQADNIKSLELANMDLTNELSSLGSLLEQERQRIQEKNAVIKSKDQELYCLKDQLNELKRNMDRLELEIKGKDLKISELTMEVAVLQGNSKELMIKIAEGEGGAKIVIDQISEEKKKLQDDIAALSITMKTQKDEHLSKVDAYDKKLCEMERAAEGKIKKLEEEKEEFNRKCRESEEELNRKAERFVEMERESEEERRKTSERVGKLKELIKQKESSGCEMRKQIDELSTQVADRDRIIREKERHIEKNKTKIEESVRHLEEAEAKARVLESDLLESKSQQETVRGSEFDLKLKLNELETVLEDYKQKTEKLSDELRDSQTALDATEQECREKEEHWRVKREEFEKQLEKNQETNDELMSTIKDLQEQINVEKIEKVTRELKINNLESKIEDTSKRINDLEAEMVEKEKTIHNLKENLDILNTDKQDLKKHVESLQHKSEEGILHVEAVENELINLKLEFDSIQKNAEMRYAKLEAECVESNGKREELDKNLEEKEQRILRLMDSNSRLENELKEKLTETEEFSIRLGKFESESAEKLRKLEEVEAEKQVIEAAQSDLIKEVESLKKDVLEKITVIEQLNARCTQFAQLSKDVQFSKDRDLSEKQVEIEHMQEKLARLEIEFVEKESTMSGEIQRLKRSLQSVQSELDEQVQVGNETKKTLEELSTVNMQFTQRIASWEDEKNALIERCLNTESDLDFERERAIENKRRFDEALSAMHELGRANQSLQMDISKHISRKWLDDSAAFNCTDCGKQFSLTVRKHHCRVCGLIYCAMCSNKTTRLASNKNPVRVCANCYVEVQNR